MTGRTTAHTSHGRRVRPWRVLAAVAIVAAGVKLWLVLPDEVVARANPYDQLLYVEMADELGQGNGFGPYGPRTLIREPAYPFWLAAVARSGLRLRVASELLLIGCAAGFAAMLLRVGAPLWLAGVGLWLLVFHPHGLIVHREVLAEALYVPVLLLALSGGLLAARSERAGWQGVHAAWAGLAMGVLATTRPEAPLVWLLLGTAAGLAAVAAAGRGTGARSALAGAARVGLVAALGIVGVSTAFAAWNQRHYGVWQTADLVSPGYVAANRALLSIEHESPRRFVPVPADVRARAYAASPAFRELRPHLEGDRWGHRVSCVMVRVCDDLAGGWFLWTFREAAAEAGHMRSAAQGDAYFLEIADDLSAACERGEIRCRPVWLPFLHPHVEAWLPFFPESLLDVVGRMVTAGRDRDRLLLADSPRLEAEVRERFDRVGNRDAELVRSGWALVEGHASAESDPIVQVELRGGRQRVVLMGDSGVTQTPQDFVPLAFELQMAKGRRLTERPVLLISRVSGARTQVYVGSAIEAPVERDGVRVELSAQPSRPVDASRKAVAWLLWHGHAWALRGLAVLALVAGAWGIARRRPRLAEPLWAIFVLVAVGIVGRVLLLAMVDASSFAAASSRYVYPASALLAFALLVFVVAIWRAPPRAGGR